jgi:hypothetical protein
MIITCEILQDEILRDDEVNAIYLLATALPRSRKCGPAYLPRNQMNKSVLESHVAVLTPEKKQNVRKGINQDHCYTCVT